jgi:adenylyltransferase/sulfurtransferase
MVGSIQAMEGIKYLVGIGELLTDRLMNWNALTMRCREIPVRRNPDCPLCGAARRQPAD